MQKFALLYALSSSLAVGCAKPVPIDEIAPRGDVPAEADVLAAAEGDWPWWRGPAIDGKSSDVQPATTWTKTKNVAWQASVPGAGHSSPIVCGPRVFLTSADESAKKQLVLCYDRKSGKSLWTTVAHEGGLMSKHGKNSHASATPACDARRVFAAFINSDALHVTATDLEGNIVWQTSAGPFRSEHGYGSSPVLYKSLVIVCGDNLSGCFLAALDRDTGEIVWRTGRKTTGRHGSYATPIVAEVAGRPQLLLHGMRSTSSYDPETGELLWSCDGPAEVAACTVAFSDELVFSSGGYPEKELLAIRADGSGDVTKSHLVWRTGKGVTYVPSPLFHAGRLYVVNDGGIATCFDAANGKQIWQGRLEGSFSSSPVLAGGLLYVTNESGKTYVLKAGPRFEVVAENDLADGGGFATPAVCGSQIFVRTEHKLYCIAEPARRAADSAGGN
jgi:hypothetical protein